eukprot:SAG11_NODE_56_length_19295_cov_20.219675_5_plen_81_part_00
MLGVNCAHRSLIGVVEVQVSQRRDAIETQSAEKVNCVHLGKQLRYGPGAPAESERKAWKGLCTICTMTCASGGRRRRQLS